MRQPINVNTPDLFGDRDSNDGPHQTYRLVLRAENFSNISCFVTQIHRNTSGLRAE